MNEVRVCLKPSYFRCHVDLKEQFNQKRKLLFSPFLEPDSKIALQHSPQNNWRSCFRKPEAQTPKTDLEKNPVIFTFCNFLQLHVVFRETCNAALLRRSRKRLHSTRYQPANNDWIFFLGELLLRWTNILILSHFSFLKTCCIITLQPKIRWLQKIESSARCISRATEKGKGDSRFLFFLCGGTGSNIDSDNTSPAWLKQATGSNLASRAILTRGFPKTRAFKHVTVIHIK